MIEKRILNPLFVLLYILETIKLKNNDKGDNAGPTSNDKFLSNVRTAVYRRNEGDDSVTKQFFFFCYNEYTRRTRLTTDRYSLYSRYR